MPQHCIEKKQLADYNVRITRLARELRWAVTGIHRPNYHPACTGGKQDSKGFNKKTWFISIRTSFLFFTIPTNTKLIHADALLGRGMENFLDDLWDGTPLCCETFVGLAGRAANHQLFLIIREDLFAPQFC